jgi:hypothetical protein
MEPRISLCRRSNSLATANRRKYRVSKPVSRFDHCQRMCQLLALFLAGTFFGDVNAEDFYTKLRACTQERDDGKRLACFDRETVALPPQDWEQKEVRASLPEFGLIEKPNPARPQKETDRVAAVTQRPNGVLVFSLENGQLWKATDQQYLPVHVGDSVTIRTGALGSFWLSAAGSNRTVRVTRVPP